MNYALDIAVLGIIIICVIAGRCRGAVRTLIYLAGLAAAFATAVFVSNAASEQVYEKAVRPAVISALESKSEELEKEYLSPEKLSGILEENGIYLTEEQLESFAESGKIYSEVLTDEEFRVTLNHVFTEYCRLLTDAFSGIIPGEIVSEAEQYIEQTDMENERKLRLLTADRQSVTEIIEREIVRPVMLKTVKAVLFAASFALVMLIVSIISRAAGLIRKISAIRSADGFFGGILGLLQGLLVTVVICVGVNVFIKLTSDGNSFLNSETINGTFIFKRLYSGTFLLLSLILK